MVTGDCRSPLQNNGLLFIFSDCSKSSKPAREWELPAALVAPAGSGDGVDSRKGPVVASSETDLARYLDPARVVSDGSYREGTSVLSRRTI